jgi:toxin ParE1/3/4
MSYRLSPKAEDDLIDIANHIASDSPAAALALVDKIEQACGMLGGNPLLGRSRPEIAPDARSWAVGNYLILHRQIRAGAEIIRVIHGARDLDELEL